MWSWLTKIAACLAPVRRHARTRKDEDGSDNGRGGVADDLLWSRDIGRHAAGEFSFAVAQANETLEDHSQVETGAAATFVGVYDGHGGAEASRFISDHPSHTLSVSTHRPQLVNESLNSLVEH